MSQNYKYYEYSVWAQMKFRCDSPNATYYERYGGRGITYDPKWKEFLSFLEDVGSRPLGYSLDRIDYNGNYTKENCRWATQSVQVHNKGKVKASNTYTGAQASQGKFRSYISKNNITYGLGTYIEELDAVYAYDLASSLIYEEGKLNFPDLRGIYELVIDIVSLKELNLLTHNKNEIMGAVFLTKKLSKSSVEIINILHDTLNSHE